MSRAVSPRTSDGSADLSQICDSLRMRRSRQLKNSMVGCDKNRSGAPTVSRPGDRDCCARGLLVRLEFEPVQLAMQRGAADAKCLGCGGYVAVRSQQGPLQRASFDVAEMLPRRVRFAEQVGGGDRLRQAAGRDVQRQLS